MTVSIEVNTNFSRGRSWNYSMYKEVNYFGVRYWGSAWLIDICLTAVQNGALSFLLILFWWLESYEPAIPRLIEIGQCHCDHWVKAEIPIERNKSSNMLCRAPAGTSLLVEHELLCFGHCLKYMYNVNTLYIYERVNSEYFWQKTVFVCVCFSPPSLVEVLKDPSMIFYSFTSDFTPLPPICSLESITYGISIAPFKIRHHISPYFICDCFQIFFSVWYEVGLVQFVCFTGWCHTGSRQNQRYVCLTRAKRHCVIQWHKTKYLLNKMCFKLAHRYRHKLMIHTHTYVCTVYM